jgi:uncharacterized protein YqgC (DUF456 family)
LLTVFLAIISTILILVGLAGTILSFIPGVFVVWVGLFIFAIGTGFARIAIATTIIFFVVMLLTFAFDIFVPMLVARKYDARKLGIMGGSLGSSLGNITLGYRGIFIGPFLGTMLGELISRRQQGRALKIAFGIILGIIAGILLKIIAVLIMLGFLIASWF